MTNIKIRPHIMGVVNVTPDSFSDGGRFIDPQQAIAHGFRLLDEGADSLDIGGESTRPGAAPVSAGEEQDRVLPVIAGLRAAGVTCPLSLDTRNASTMRHGLKAGATIINDISALTHDAEALSIVSDAQCPVILMHMRGTPQTMQQAPAYGNVVDDVLSYLAERIKVCTDSGIRKSNIIADPGIGFGKTLGHNLTLLKNLSKFQALDVPILLGASRKSFIEKICGATPAEDRLGGSLTAALIGMHTGLQYLRVHDVRQTVQAIRVWQAIQSM